MFGISLPFWLGLFRSQVNIFFASFLKLWLYQIIHTVESKLDYKLRKQEMSTWYHIVKDILYYNAVAIIIWHGCTWIHKMDENYGHVLHSDSKNKSLIKIKCMESSVRCHICLPAKCQSSALEFGLKCTVSKQNETVNYTPFLTNPF